GDGVDCEVATGVASGFAAIVRHARGNGVAGDYARVEQRQKRRPFFSDEAFYVFGVPLDRSGRFAFGFERVFATHAPVYEDLDISDDRRPAQPATGAFGRLSDSDFTDKLVQFSRVLTPGVAREGIVLERWACHSSRGCDDGSETARSRHD